MTECPFIPSTADRLLQQHRPSRPVCSGPERRKDRAKRLFPRLELGQSLMQNLETVEIKPHTNASVAFTDTADNALCP